MQKLVWLAALMLSLQVPAVLAQGTAFTYQGRLNAGGQPASGSYDIQFTLYTNNQTGLVYAGPVTNLAVNVTNGLFTTAVDFGSGVFLGQNLWLDLAVRTNSAGAFNELTPRQQLAATPYAVFANSASNLVGTLSTAQLAGSVPASQLTGTLPSSLLSGTYGNAVSFNNGANTFDGTFTGEFIGSMFLGGSFNGQFFGDGSDLININPAHINANLAYLNSNQVFTAQNVFAQGIGIGNPNPLYSVDALGSQAVIRLITTNTYNGSVLELWNTYSNYNAYLGAVNFHNQSGDVGQIGYIQNDPTTPLYDSLQFRVATTLGMTIQADPRGLLAASLVGGYPGNYVLRSNSGGDAIVSGGAFNQANSILANSSDDFIGSGLANQIGVNTLATSIVGGNLNTNNSAYALIGGGTQNLIQYNNWGAFIGAGSLNTIQTGSGYSSIPAGTENMILSNASYCVIAGGDFNTNGGPSAAIGGGYYNSILANSSQAVIGGGQYNFISTNDYNSVIGGGFQNQVQGNASSSSIGGGVGNQIASTNYDILIGGGYYNYIGSFNVIANINGGFFNRIDGNYPLYTNFTVTGSTIDGGAQNTIQMNNSYDFIGGGFGNLIQSNIYGAAIVGGENNAIQLGSYESFIGGGVGNNIGNNSTYCSMLAGYYNTIQSNAEFSVVVGGWGNVIATNGFNDTIGCGLGNYAGGSFSTIPGGLYNQATGNGSFAAGAYAVATNNGAFVLSDYEFTNFTSTASNQLSARFTGGIVFVTGGAGMTLDGQPVMSSAAPVLPSQLSGIYTNPVFFVNPADSFTGSGAALTQLNASALTLGTVPSTAISGNYSNIVAFTNSGNMFGGDGSRLTNVNATLLNGNSASAFAPYSGSSNYIQNQNNGVQPATFAISGNGTVGGTMTAGAVVANNVIVNSNAQVTGLLISGTGTGTSEAPNPAGIIVRRVNSTNPASNSVVAVVKPSGSTTNILLVRDGTYGGFQIQYPANPGNVTIACMGIDTNGVSRNFYIGLPSPGIAGTVQIYSDSQHIVHFECTFGVTFLAGQHLTHVTLSRYQYSSALDYYWSGDMISTYDQ